MSDESGDTLSEPSHYERAHFGDPREVAVDVDDAEVVIQGRFGDEEVRNGDAMPQPVMVGEVPLEAQGSFEDIGRGGNDDETPVKVLLQFIVVLRRTG